jgi:tryptophan halogenase
LNFNRAHWWIGERSHLPGVSYAADISPQYRLAAEGKAPRRPEMTEYDGLLGYAYHLDAEALAEFLAERALKDGVYRVFDDVLDSVVAPDGSISSVICKAGGQIDGDFFVDCTGFAGLLTSKALGVGFESYGDQLFCDRAVAFRVPLDERSPIRPFTTATARKAGWIWEIDLQRRSGVGYVYSSAHVSDDEAEKELRRYIGSKAGSETARHLRMRVGRTRSFWTKNVAAIGLSGGFIEPLESTGIFLIQIGAVQLADSLVGVLGLARNSSLEPGYGAYLEALRPLAKRYTESMAVYYEELRDFIKLHYFLSNRTDSKFWLDNAKSESASESFVERLNEWRTRPPQSFDFTNRLNLFNEHSWLYIMFGMGWTPTEKTGLAPFTDPQRGSGLLAQVHARAKRASESLPDHRAYFRMAAKPVHPARDVEAAA